MEYNQGDLLADHSDESVVGMIVLENDGDDYKLLEKWHDGSEYKWNRYWERKRNVHDMIFVGDFEKKASLPDEKFASLLDSAGILHQYPNLAENAA